MARSIDEVMADYRSIFAGRTRYAGQEPWADEILVAEIERLRALVDVAKVDRAAWMAPPPVHEWNIMVFDDAKELLVAAIPLTDEQIEALRPYLGVVDNDDHFGSYPLVAGVSLFIEEHVK